ncbi:hypothetical protein [Candidatus Palauibacter sp.]|uniref:hypothetical protein n=1 Tax=Candidatus Palauibacter sp. TaxID=3101350 RepID=UPI003B024FA9
MTARKLPLALSPVAVVFAFTVSACAAPESEGAEANSTVPDTESEVSTAVEVDAKEGSLDDENKGVGDAAADAAAAEAKGTDLIYMGQRVTGRLAYPDRIFHDGSYFDEWVLEVPSSGTVQVDMASDDVDSYLQLWRGSRYGSGWTRTAVDDDGGPGINARIIEYLRPGVYTIVANTYRGGDAGRYWLSVGWR